MRFLVFIQDNGLPALCEGGAYTDGAAILVSCEDYQENTIAKGEAEAAALNARAGRTAYELRETLDGCVPVDADVLSSLAPWMKAALPDDLDLEVGRHRRVQLYYNTANGFHASASCAVHFGYCDTLDELKAEIGDHFAEEEEHYRGIDTPEDTPSLDDTFHRIEMDVA